MSDYICSETLAVEMTPVQASNGEAVELNDAIINVGVQRA
jgi:hypothetical protein